MGKVKKKEMPGWAKSGHSRPMSRREFLAHGLIPFAASALVPGALGLLMPSRASAAASCASGMGGSLYPFITLNLAGGAGLSANFVPRNANGELLSSYTKMGLGNNTGANALPIETEFGVPAFAGRRNNNLIGQLLQGIRNTASAEALQKTAFVGLCVQSRDDTAENKFDASGMVYKVGLEGSLVPNLGTEKTSTGLRMQAAIVTPPPPLVVANVNDIFNSIGYTRALRDSLNVNQREALTKLVSGLSASQSRKLAAINSAAHVNELVECAGIKNNSLIAQGSGAVDPVGSAPAVASLWGFNAQTAAGNENRVFGTMVYNGLAGNAGTINLEKGGYDYHDGTRTTGDTRDRQAGEVIGRILESAKIMGKPVFLYVTTDGSVVSGETAAPGAAWTSDRGNASAALVFMFHPNGRPQTSGFQIGSYTNGQVADGSHVVGNNPQLAAQAVLANYLKFNNRMDLWGRVVTRSSVLSGATLDEVIKVG